MEIAPYQRTAAQNQEKSDPKCSQILLSDEYKAFLEELEKKKEPVTSSSSAKVQASLAVIEARAKEMSAETITPLMEFVRAQYEEREQQFPGKRSGGKPGRFETPPKKDRGKETKSSGKPGFPSQSSGVKVVVPSEVPRKPSAADFPSKKVAGFASRKLEALRVVASDRPNGKLEGEPKRVEPSKSAPGECVIARMVVFIFIKDGRSIVFIVCPKTKFPQVWLS